MNWWSTAYHNHCYWSCRLYYTILQIVNTRQVFSLLFKHTEYILKQHHIWNLFTSETALYLRVYTISEMIIRLDWLRANFHVLKISPKCPYQSLALLLSFFKGKDVGLLHQTSDFNVAFEFINKLILVFFWSIGLVRFGDESIKNHGRNQMIVFNSEKVLLAQTFLQVNKSMI